MSLAVRRVPPDWVHPKDEDGYYRPLYDGADYERRAREWDQEAAKWQEGLRGIYGTTESLSTEAERQDSTYAELECDRPDPRGYTPPWPASHCTHWQMYEEVTRGTPVSPVCRSPEELAHWMSTNGGSAFASAGYQEWLSLIRQGPLRMW
jgi:hypothetical protein